MPFSVIFIRKDQKRNFAIAVVIMIGLNVRVMKLNIPGGPKNGTVDTVDFLGLCSEQQLFFAPCWIEHHFLIIITPRSSNLVEKFLFYE